MRSPPQPQDPVADAAEEGEAVEEPDPADAEVVEGVPVLDAGPEEIVTVEAGTRSPARRRPAGSSAAVQAAAAAAGGFVAGAAMLSLLQRRQRRAAALVRAQRPGRVLGRRAVPGAGTVSELVQIVGTRSLLVDVHLLGGSSPTGER